MPCVLHTSLFLLSTPVYTRYSERLQVFSESSGADIRQPNYHCLAIDSVGKLSQANVNLSTRGNKYVKVKPIQVRGGKVNKLDE